MYLSEISAGGSVIRYCQFQQKLHTCSDSNMLTMFELRSEYGLHFDLSVHKNSKGGFPPSLNLQHIGGTY
jgi:hypothetical protein